MTTIKQNTSSGLRYNEGKLPMHLISWKAIQEAAKVLRYGATKYAERNWEKGLSFSDTFSCLQRHLIAWYDGEDIDKETGESHMAHVLTNAMFLMHFIVTGTGTDDRPIKKEPLPSVKRESETTRTQIPQPNFFPLPALGEGRATAPYYDPYRIYPIQSSGAFGSRVEQGYSGFLSEENGDSVEPRRLLDLQADVRKETLHFFRPDGRVG